MTPGEVGALLTLVTILEESRPCNIALLTTAGITPKPRIQLTTFTTFPPMIPIAAAYETTTSALKTPVLVGRKFIRRKNHGILPRVENGPSATSRLPTLQSTLGPPIAKGLLSSYNVKEGQTGDKRGRVGIGTMGAARVGGRTTPGSQDKVVTLAASLMMGSVGIFKMTVLNAIQKTGYGSLLHRGNHRHGVGGVAKAIATKTTDATRIGIGMAGAGKKVGTTTNKSGISDLMIVT
jgi:hypothetical protein